VATLCPTRHVTSLILLLSDNQSTLVELNRTLHLKINGSCELARQSRDFHGQPERRDVHKMTWIYDKVQLGTVQGMLEENSDSDEHSVMG